MLVTSPLQDQVGNIVMRKGLDETTSSKTAANLDSSASSEVKRLKNILKGLSASVLSLTVRFDGLILAVWKIAMCNIRELNNPMKQNNVIHWHKDKNNLVSIFMKLKLSKKVHSWIVNKFDGIWVFTSGLESGHLGASVVIIMNSSLARHVCKVLEVLGWLLSIKLLFKNKLLVSVLELYAGAFQAVCFSQTGEINSLITKAVNKSSFVILGGDFNKDSLCKSASFKKCLDLSLVNSLTGSKVLKKPTWENFRDIIKMINYVLVSPNLVNMIVYHNILGVDEHFEMDYQAVSVFINLGGLLDMQLNSFYKQANRDH
ncbi:hypothetical protein G9A89_011071 [Geosiphon pyriformis]|nr:hypothetical protein G9A89_011071 [Geosiphon pyriformis]